MSPPSESLGPTARRDAKPVARFLRGDRPTGILRLGRAERVEPRQLVRSQFNVAGSEIFRQLVGPPGSDLRLLELGEVLAAVLDAGA